MIAEFCGFYEGVYDRLIDYVTLVEVDNRGARIGRYFGFCYC